MAARSEIPTLLLVHGDEAHLVDLEARAWLAAARRRASGELDVEVFDGPSRLDGVRRSLSEIPLIDPLRFVLIRDPQQLTDRARKGADGAETLAEALAQRSPTTSVCLVAHRTVAAGNPVLTRLRELGGQTSHHPRLRGRELTGWLQRRLREKGVAVDQQGVEHLLLVCGSDLGALDGEVDKLAAYSGGRRLPAEEVRRVAAGGEQVEVWSVAERLLARPPGRGAAAVEALLAEGTSSQYVLVVLAGQLRDVLVAQEILAGQQGGAAAVARELQVPPWRAERLARQASAVAPGVVAAWLRALQRLDADVKAGRMDDRDGLRNVALRAAAWASDPAPATRGSG